MRQIFSLFFIILFFINVTAQSIIKGKVIDEEKNPVCFINVFLKGNTSIGTITNTDGLFELQVDNIVLSDTIIFYGMGYITKNIPVNQIKTNNFLEIILVKKTNTLSEVIISAPSITKEFSIKEMDRITIYMLPISSGDPLKAICFLPYSTNTTENANPELRGSSSDFSRVIVNNIPVYNPVRNTQLSGMGNFSLLNTEIIDNQIIYAGNPPLKYGNSIAGLVEVQTAKKLQNPNQLRLALSLANLGFLYSNEIKKKSFFQVYGNHQFSSAYLAINKKNSNYITDFTSSDFGLNFHSQFSEKFSANIFSYVLYEKYNADNTMFNYYGNSAANAKRNFNIVNIEYIGKKFSLSLNNGTNFSQNDFLFGNIVVQQRENQVYTSIDSKIYLLRYLTFQAGIAHDYTNIKFSNTFPSYYYSVFPFDSTYSFRNSTHNHNFETYLYSKLSIRKFVLGVGLRKNIPIEKQDNYLSYQASLRYTINSNHSLLLSGGKYNGYSIPDYLDENFTHINSMQLALDYMFNAKRFNINVSVYAKKEKAPFFFPDLEDLVLSEIKIYGVEFSCEYSLNKFIFSASYVWLYSRINRGKGWFKGDNDLNYLVRGNISYLNNKWINASISFVFRPGLYYTPIDKSLYIDEINNYKPIYGVFNSRRYGNYSSIDLTLNKAIPFKEAHIVLFLTISNLLNTSNQAKCIYNLDYSLTRYWLYQKMLFYFGAMISL